MKTELHPLALSALYIAFIANARVLLARHVLDDSIPIMCMPHERMQYADC